MTEERLSGLDTAFLSLERDVTPMQLGALAIFRTKRPTSAQQVAELLVERAQHIPRLRRTVQPSWFPPGSALWSDDPRFHAEDHIQVHEGNGGGRDSAAELTSRLMAKPLPRNRPLWELHVMSGLDADGFAVLVKVHHAFADGLGALEIGVGLLDGARAGAGAGGAAGNGVRNGRPTSQVADAATAAPQSGSRRLAGGVQQFAVGAVGQAGEMLGMAASVLRHVRLPTPGSPLMISSSGNRGLALAQIDLDQVRRIRMRHGGTANDVMLAIVAGAMRDWFSSRGHAVDGLNPRALIPVSSRARSGNRANGNQMSGYLCELPVGEPDPVQRLRHIRLAMERSKAAGTRRGPGAIPLLADQLPPALHKMAAPAAGQAASLLFDILVTSVPLPGIPMCLAGAELAEVFPVAPLAPTHALGVALSSYRGSVYVGLHADREAMPDLDGLAEAIPAAAALLES